MRQEQAASQSEKHERWGRRAIGYSLLIGGPLILFLVLMAARFQGLTSPETMDQAQLARNLARGDGFVTRFVRPLSLVFKADINPHPDLYNAPVYPLVLSLFFRMMGTDDRIVILSSGLFWLLTIWLTFWLTDRWVNRPVAILATFLYAVNIEMLSKAITGREFSFSTLLFLLLLFCLHPQPWSEEDPEGPPSRWSLVRLLLIGLITGLCSLTDYLFLFLIGPLLWYVVWGAVKSREPSAPRALSSWGPRLRPAGIVLAVCFLIWLPWLGRNVRVVGTPLFTLQQYDLISGTPSFVGQKLQRTLDVDPPSLVLFPVRQARQMGRKIALNLLSLRNELPQMADWYVAMFFLVGIFIPLRGQRVGPLRGFLYLSLVLLGGVLSLTRAEEARLLPLIPLITILAAAGAWQILGDFFQTSRVQWLSASTLQLLVVVVWGWIVVFPLVASLRLNPPPRESSLRASLEQLGDRFAESDVIMTDLPWAVAWYADRTAVWLCQEQEQLVRFQMKYGLPQGIYLSPTFRRYGPGERAPWWDLLAESPVYMGLEVDPSWREGQLRVPPDQLTPNRDPSVGREEGVNGETSR